MPTKKTPCESEAVVRTSPPKTANKVRSGAQSLGLWGNGPCRRGTSKFPGTWSRDRGYQGGPVQTQDWGIQDCSVEFRSFYQHTAAPPLSKTKIWAWRLAKRLGREPLGSSSVSSGANTASPVFLQKRHLLYGCRWEVIERVGPAQERL